jgi:hypothetical protein
VPKTRNQFYTNQHDGVDRELMPRLDEHARPVIARGLSARQTVAAGVAGRKAAGLTDGVPRPLGCDHGSQVTGRACRRVGAGIPWAVDDAPPHAPQDPGPLERWLRTARRERPRAQAPEIATGRHAVWLEESHHARRHRRVTEAAGHAQAPVVRVRWQPSAARPLPPVSSVDDGVHVQRPRTGPRTRPVTAARCISDRQPSSPLPAWHQGDVLEGTEGQDHLHCSDLGPLGHRLRKP